MRLPLTDTFQHQRRSLRFHFTCEDCVHHDAREDVCVHRYPDHIHRATAFAPEGPLDGVFCKEFELV